MTWLGFSSLRCVRNDDGDNQKTVFSDYFQVKGSLAVRNSNHLIEIGAF
jgi:hypothetical protein